MVVRIGRARGPEPFALACLLVQIDRLGRPVQRGFLAAVEDTYGEAIPSRRAGVLRALLAEARTIEAAARERSDGAALAALLPIVQAR